jgi:hypothetical protein
VREKEQSRRRSEREGGKKVRKRKIELRRGWSNAGVERRDE